MRLSRSPRRPRAPRSPEGSRRLSDCALEVPPEVGLIGVAEGGCQRCERGRIRPRELHGGLVQSIALDNPFGADSHVGPEAPLKRPRVEPAGRGDVLDAEDRSIAGHALHEIAQAQESRARRGDERREERLGDRDLVVDVARFVDRQGPGVRLRSEDLFEGDGAIGEARHRGPEERLEHHRSEGDPERPSFAHEASHEAASLHAKELRASLAGRVDVRDLRRGMGQYLGGERRAEGPSQRPEVMDVRREPGRGHDAPPVEQAVGRGRTQDPARRRDFA